MKKTTFKVKGKVWLYSGSGAWHFVYIDKKTSKTIKESTKNQKRKGFGSVPVTAVINKSRWKTSIFPDKGGVYLLPLKAEIRKKAEILNGDTITFSIIVKS